MDDASRRRQRSHPAADGQWAIGLKLLALRPEQHFTEPPPRFSEASLVKALEEHGIGRPSTYASIISDAGQQEIHGAAQSPLHADRSRQDRQPLPDAQFRSLRRLRLHRQDGRRPRRDRRRPAKPGCRCSTASGRNSSSSVDLVDETVTREDVSEARELGNDPVTGKPISVRYGKYGPFVQMGTKDDEEKPKFASLKADAAHGHAHAAGGAGAVQAAAHARARLPTAMRSASPSAASVPTCSTARRSSSRSRTTIRTPSSCRARSS